MSNAVAKSDLPAFLGNGFRTLWLQDSVPQIAFAIIFALVAIRPAAATKIGRRDHRAPAGNYRRVHLSLHRQLYWRPYFSDWWARRNSWRVTELLRKTGLTGLNPILENLNPEIL
jgi:hypothetical protein